MVESSRSNPKQMDYFQNAADLVGVFGLFHQQLVADKFLPFALNEYVREPLKPLKPHSDPRDLSPLANYGRQASDSLVNGWVMLMDMHDRPTILPKPNLMLPDHYSVYKHPYVKELITGTLAKAKDGGSAIGVLQAATQMDTIINGAFDNATRTLAQLCAIFGDDFEPGLALMMSRVAILNNIKARDMIGVESNGRREERTYELLHGKDKLDRDKLKEFGRGRVIGCPASTPVSELTRKFIEEQFGVDVKHGSMLRRYALDFKADFDNEVQKPFDEMSEEEREKFYSYELRSLLSGDKWNYAKKKYAQSLAAV